MTRGSPRISVELWSIVKRCVQILAQTEIVNISNFELHDFTILRSCDPLVRTRWWSLVGKSHCVANMPTLLALATLGNMTQMHNSVRKFLFVFRIDILKVYGAASPKVVKGSFTLTTFVSKTAGNSGRRHYLTLHALATLGGATKIGLFLLAKVSK